MPKHRLTPAQVKELFGVERVEPKGKPPRRLNNQKFYEAFGIRRSRAPSRQERRAIKKANELFSDMSMVYEVSSLEVFRAAAEELHADILHQMSRCPKFVLDYMERQLEPARVDAYRHKTAEQLRAGIARRESALRRIT